MSQKETFLELLETGAYTNLPSVGDTVKGAVISNTRRQIHLDIGGLTTGVIRGRELFAESAEYRGLAPGDIAEATVIELENENGEMELSFRFAGQQKAWEVLRERFTKGEVIETKILEANKGGLIVTVDHITGFLPVSQLSPEHYPRVSGGDKNKILEKLKSYMGKSMTVKIIDVNENDEKLIVSEKAVWEQRQQDVIARYQPGDVIEGTITAIADFGAFVKFEQLEGLVHISEIAWQRIDHPRDIVKIGETVKAQIIGIEGTKIFLSMKKLIEDPWSTVESRYKIGDLVEGKVLKVNPFGFFVELDPEIHGLAHVSELTDGAATDVMSIAKAGETLTFRVVSIEPKEHRLGLSRKGLETTPASSKAAEEPGEKPATEKKPSAPTISEEEPSKEPESVPETI